MSDACGTGSLIIGDLESVDLEIQMNLRRLYEV
jgi:hypothetical protein